MRFAMLFPLLLVAACQSSPKPDSANDACQASQHQNLIGTPAASINSAQLPERTRIIHPDTAVTRDYRIDRLNIHVDAAGQVERVVCG